MHVDLAGKSFMKLTHCSSPRSNPRKIDDWEVAYSHRIAVPEFPQWLAGAKEKSGLFHNHHVDRASIDVPYGKHARQTFDVYEPSGAALGTLIFIHGGFWKASVKEEYRYLAAGPIARGWRVVFPEYPLCPEVTIADIIGGLVPAVEQFVARWGDAPIVLSGHSAGGHLATYLASAESGVSSAALHSIRRVVSLSGLHDLRPLVLAKELNAVLKLDRRTAHQLSPVLREPEGAFDLVCACGDSELDEFRRQNRLLADIWFGLGIQTAIYEYPSKNHFTLLDSLNDESSELTALVTLGM
jgi:arylformamidase